MRRLRAGSSIPMASRNSLSSSGSIWETSISIFAVFDAGPVRRLQLPESGFLSLAWSRRPRIALAREGVRNADESVYVSDAGKVVGPQLFLILVELNPCSSVRYFDRGRSNFF